jgi:hypothetical protein
MTALATVSDHHWMNHPESSFLPPKNVLHLTRNNAHYIEPYQPEDEVLERSLSTESSFVWPTGTIVFQPLK